MSNKFDDMLSGIDLDNYEHEYREDVRRAILENQRKDIQDIRDYVESLEFENARLRDAHGECLWRLENDDTGEWQTGCGESWLFLDGDPVDNDMKFCPFCGKVLKIQEPEPPESA